MAKGLYENVLTKECWFVDSNDDVETIDGVEYLIVRHPITERVFKMRKDALKKIVDNNSKSWHNK